MVLESVVISGKLDHHPTRMMPIGFLYASIGILFGLLVFGSYASIAAIFLTTMPLVVILFRAIVSEENKDLKICKEYLLIKEHIKILKLFIYLFLGIVFAYSFWIIVLPLDVVTLIAQTQMETISSIGAKMAATGAATSSLQTLEIILLNNLRVLGFCIFFSFLYGAGAIFILTWNASVLGVAIGNVIRETLSSFGPKVGVFHYFAAIPIGLTYLVHGIPEVASYFLGALGGGIISVAVANHHVRSPRFWNVLRDSVDLILLSLFVLVAAGLIEVYITPLIIG